LYAKLLITHPDVAGAELGQNVVEAYHFICSNYEQGDEIYLFGFSRGAFTARALGGLLCSVGILKKTFMAYFPEIYAKYHKNEHIEDVVTTIDEEAFKNYQDIYGTDIGYQGIHEAYGVETPNLATKYGGENPPMVEIQVIGVWDTVGALGWPETWIDSFFGSGWRNYLNSGYRYLNTALSDRKSLPMRARSPMLTTGLFCQVSTMLSMH